MSSFSIDIPGDLHLRISLAEQMLRVVENGAVVAEYPVSTACNGAGELYGSGCTPRGWHRIRARIGAGLPAGTVFVGRRPTGEIFCPELAAAHPERDWILTRILWLGGLEPGRNRFGAVDTARRYIYIHGSPDDAAMGSPASHGCVRMRNADILQLFERVTSGALVLIDEG
jgi:lipoprotein-anchoring transpeptidase ErfK/SrfK